MRLIEYDQIHKLARLTIDKEEIEQLAQFLNNLGGKWTQEAKDESKKKALELMKMVEEITKCDLEAIKDDIEQLKRDIQE